MTSGDTDLVNEAVEVAYRPPALTGESSVPPNAAGLRTTCPPRSLPLPTIAAAFFVVCVLTTAVTCHVQTKSVPTPQAVTNAFRSRYPNSSLSSPRPELDKFDRWEFHFSLHGRQYRADFLSDGSWWHTEETIKTKTLPIAVRSSLERWFRAKWDRELSSQDIKKIEQVWEPKNRQQPISGERTFIDVKVKCPDDKSNKLDVRFLLDGSLIDEEAL